VVVYTCAAQSITVSPAAGPSLPGQSWGGTDQSEMG